jgi:hypothetical protein
VSIDQLHQLYFSHCFASTLSSIPEQRSSTATGSRKDRTGYDGDTVLRYLYTPPCPHTPGDLKALRGPSPPGPGEAREIPPWAGPLLARLVCRAPNCSLLPPVTALRQKLLLHLLFSSFTPPYLNLTSSSHCLASFSISSLFSSLYLDRHKPRVPSLRTTLQSFVQPRHTRALLITNVDGFRPYHLSITTTYVNIASSALFNHFKHLF